MRMRPEHPLDPPHQVVELRAGPVSYTSTGSGRPLVAVHGMPASGRDFRWFDAAMAGRMRMVRPDLPGFGVSSVAGHAGCTVPDFAAAVIELCEALALQDAVVLGHSMGGPIALEAAAQSPRITALALVSSAGPVFHRGIFPRTYGVAVRLTDVHPVLRRLTLTVGKPIARAVGFSKHLSDEEMIRAVRFCAGYRPRLFEERLTRLDKPVLIAWADDDRAVEPRVSRALEACVESPHRAHFKTGGHNLQSSRSVELADALVAWADEL
jgi:pimeloyl-ACP methyl ester carboxylesterase